MKILFYAYLQLLLISMNTVNVATGRVLPSIILSFLIGIAWCVGVKGVATGSLKEKLMYCTGCCLGCGSGVILSNALIQEQRYNDNMKIKILHPFSSHDNYFKFTLNAEFYWLPWYRKCRDEDIWTESKDAVYYNYFGWTWFTMSWMSVK